PAADGRSHLIGTIAGGGSSQPTSWVRSSATNGGRRRPGLIPADATQAGEFGHLSFISRPGGAEGSGVLARGEHGGGARMTGVIRLRRPVAGRYLRKGARHAVVRRA